MERRKVKGKYEFLRLTDLGRRLRGNGALTEKALGLAVECLTSVCSFEAYKHWKKASRMEPFFDEPDWTHQENRRKFSEYAVASYLDLLRPGSIGWRGLSPSVKHMECVARLLRALPRAQTTPLRRAVRQWIEGRSELELFVKTLNPQKEPYPKPLLLLVWKNRNLKPKAFAEQMRQTLARFDFKLSEKPDSYRKQVERLKKACLEHEHEFCRLSGRDVT